MSTIQEFDFNIDLNKTVLWQYEGAPNLNQLRAFQQAWLDENHTAFWDNWAVDVFDVRTANDFGLLVWAKILNLQLYTDPTVSPDDYPNWGFADFGDNFESMTDSGGNFANDGNRALLLNTEQKRIIIQMRYFCLANNETPPNINRFLNSLFGVETSGDNIGRARAFIVDGLNMRVTYYLSLTINQTLRLAMESLGVLPRPSAVKLNVINFYPIGSFSDNFSTGFGYD
jgi:hypothetical protein